MTKRPGSVGVVKTKFFEFEQLQLDNKEVLSPVRLAYETYGRLNKDKTNAILLCHALSGDAHAAGKSRKDSRRHGWYDIAVGPGKTFDTNRFFVICSNVIGGCKGSTGPSSINPRTKRPYGLDFPIITVRDMVRAQKRLIDHLGITKLFCVTGGSMGGFQVIEWAITYPDSVHLAIPVAAAAKQYPIGLVFNDIGRKIILSDPEFNGGNYYGKGQPKRGLSLARQIGHVTYLSQDSLLRKFGRKKIKAKNGRKKFSQEFELQSYFEYKGRSFVRRFDANSYLYLTNAVDHFDLTDGGNRQLAEAFKPIRAKFLIISFSSDWLYSPEQVEEVYSGLAEAGIPSIYRRLDLPYGHDAFLVYNNTLGNLLFDFISKEARSYFG
jgi:homoserine O-acetyltransferase